MTDGKEFKNVIRVGSRASRLAVIQSEIVIRQIEEACPDVRAELITMKTTGDRILDKTLDQIGGKGLFVKELDEALRAGEVDLTVHSLKDLPGIIPEDLPLAAFSHREDPRDVLVLPEGKTEIDLSLPVGTSSLRRSLQIKELIGHGGLVSDEIVAKIIEKKLSENMSSAGFLFDGYPRTVRQAEILEEMMERFGISLTGVLSLEVPEELLIERMLERGKTSGRADDNLDSIKHRFEEYYEKTHPVTDFYEGKGNLHAVNGVGEIPQIFENLCTVIDAL